MSIAYAKSDFQFNNLRHSKFAYHHNYTKKHRRICYLFTSKSLFPLCFLAGALFDSAEGGRRQQKQAEHTEHGGAAGPPGGGRLAHVAQRRVAALGARVQLGALADHDAARLAPARAVPLQRPQFGNRHQLVVAGRVRNLLHLQHQQ